MEISIPERNNKIVSLALQGHNISKIAETLKCRKGIIKDVLKFITIDGKNIIEHQKQTVFDLLDHLQQLALKLNKIPNKDDIKAEGKYKISNYNLIFGNVNRACKVAGLGTKVLARNPKIKIRKKTFKKNYKKSAGRQTQQLYDRNVLIAHLQELAEKLGRTPGLRDIKQGKKFSRSAYEKTFNSFILAQQEAGLRPNKITGTSKRPTYKVSAEELISHLQKLKQDIGRTPAISDVRKANMFPVSAYRYYFGTFSIAQQKAGFEPYQRGGSHMAHSKEELLDHLRKLNAKLGRLPLSTDLKGKYSFSSYNKYFGSLLVAKKLAGLSKPDITKDSIANFLKDQVRKGEKPTLRKIRKIFPEKIFYSHFSSSSEAFLYAGLKPLMRSKKRIRPEPEELIKYLKKLKTKLKRNPLINDMRSDGIYADGDFHYHFRTFNNALIEAGLQPNLLKRVNLPAKEELVAYLKELSLRLGRTPILKKDIKADGKYLESDFIKAYGSYSNMVELAGLKKNKKAPFARKISSPVSKKVLINHLKKLADKLGHTPMVKDILINNKYPESYYRRAFGTFNNAFKEAGLPFNKRPQIRFENLNETLLLTYLKQLNNSLGRVPTAKDILSEKQYTLKNFSSFFGSLANALYEAGLVPKKTYVSNEQLISHLSSLAEKVKGIPHYRQISESLKELKLSYLIYYTRFGSMDAALTLAGLDPANKPGRKKISDEELLSYLRELAARTGKIPVYSIILKDGKYYTGIFLKRFGTLKNAVERAGITSNKQGQLQRLSQ